jgi:hypothetical protein
MIELDSRKLRFLRNGRTIELDAPRRYAIGKAITVQVHGEQRSRLRVQVLDAVEVEPGAWKLTVQQYSREEVWYLTANPGAQRNDYTQNPARAAREPSGGLVEAIRDRDVTLARYAREALKRDDAIRRDRAAKRPKSRKRRYAP